VHHGKVTSIIQFDYREIFGLVEKILVLISVLEMFPVFTLIGTKNAILAQRSTVQEYCDKCNQASELHHINFILQPSGYSHKDIAGASGATEQYRDIKGQVHK
jgi:hypothetical protein